MGILFNLGQVVMTQGVAEIAHTTNIHGHLARHLTGDWGNVSVNDLETNDDAVKHGDRILSAYPINPSLPCKGFGENTLWIITEADRSVTAILLPGEY